MLIAERVVHSLKCNADNRKTSSVFKEVTFLSLILMCVELHPQHVLQLIYRLTVKQ